MSVLDVNEQQEQATLLEQREPCECDHPDSIGMVILQTLGAVLGVASIGVAGWLFWSNLKAWLA